MYPTDWKQLRATILERAEDACEWCRVANNQVILRAATGDDYLIYDAEEDIHYDDFGEPVRLSEFPEGYEDSQYVVVVLTIAHTNNTDPTCDPANLTALCQHCRAKHESPARARKEAAKRQRKQEETTGQLRMFE